MRFQTTILLLLLNLLAWSFLLWRSQVSEEVVERVRLLSIDRNTIDGVGIRTGEQGREVRLQGERWEITEPIRWSANPYAVQKLIDLLYTESTLSFELDEREENLATYGLDKPFLEIVVYSGAQTYLLNFGRPENGGESVYVRGPSRGRVSAIDAAMLEGLPLSLNQLRNVNVYQAQVFAIDAFTMRLRNPDVTIRLIRHDDGSWSFESPIRAKADQKRVMNVLNLLTALRVARFVDTAEVGAAPMGLDAPSLRVTLSGAGGREVLLLGDRDPKAPESIPAYFARREELETPFTVLAEPFEKLRNQWDHLRDHHLFHFDPVAIETLSWQAEGASGRIRLQKLESGYWQVLENAEEGVRAYPADPSVLRELVQLLSEFEIEAFISDAPSDEDLARFGLKEVEPVLSLKEGGKEYRLLVGSAIEGEPSRYARIEGEPTVFSIGNRWLEQLPPAAVLLRSRTLELLPESAVLAEVLLIEESEEGPRERRIDLSEEQHKELLQALQAELSPLKVVHYMPGESDDRGFVPAGGEGVAWKQTLQLRFRLPGAQEEELSQQRLLISEELQDRRVARLGSDASVFQPTDGLLMVIEAIEKLPVAVDAETPAP